MATGSKSRKKWTASFKIYESHDEKAHEVASGKTVLKAGSASHKLRQSIDKKIATISTSPRPYDIFVVWDNGDKNEQHVKNENELEGTNNVHILFLN